MSGLTWVLGIGFWELTFQLQEGLTFLKSLVVFVGKKGEWGSFQSTASFSSVYPLSWILKNLSPFLVPSMKLSIVRSQNLSNFKPQQPVIAEIEAFERRGMAGRDDCSTVVMVSLLLPDLLWCLDLRMGRACDPWWQVSSVFPEVI